jgi:hypothetical protein
VTVEQIVDPLAMSRCDHRLELLFRHVALVFADVFGRDDGVDPVWLAVDMLVDPLQLELQLLGAVGHRAQHPEATGSADGSHHVAAVAKGKDGEFDPQLFADFGLHASP